MACLCYAHTGAYAADAAVPLEVYGRLPSLEDVALSPSGERIAFVRTSGDTRIVTLFSLADHKALSVLRVGDQKLRSIEWADENHLVIMTSVTGMPLGFRGEDAEWFQVQVYDVINHKSYQIPRRNSSGADVRVMNVIAGRVMIRRDQGHTKLFVPGVYVENTTLPALFRIDLDTAAQTLVRKGAAGDSWLIDAGGEVVAEQGYDEGRQRWRLRARREGRLQDVVSGQAAIEFPHFVGFGPTADTLLMQTRDDEDSVWRLLSLKDGSLGPPMAESRTLNAPIEDHLNGRMIGGVHMDDTAQYVFFDPAMQARWDAITHAFEGERVSLISAADGFAKFVVRVDGAKDGYRYELVDLRAHRADIIGEVYQGIVVPLETRRITYAAADAVQIPAYLTLPRGRAARNLPLIVLPHGGPAARDTADFGWWSQALADQGYAVLRPNYRGSALSVPFVAAGYGQWGRKMQTDLSDGVRYLVKEGTVDPARVCIFGGSYGGYAALAGVTLDPGIYRCAISVAGLSDLKGMLNWVNNKHFQNDSIEQRYWDRFMGVSGPGDPALNEISPIKHIDAVKVPVLLIHGRDDTVVPFEQSSEMVDALRRAGKEVEFVILPHEDHWLSRSETRLQMLQASVAFLRVHNPAD
jgi:dienelactone hydrolase